MANAVAVFPPGWRLTDTNDDPVSGGTIEFYAAGTTTPKTVYSDNALTVSIGTTVTTDASGYPSSGGNKVIVYLGTADYKVILKKADGTILATHDNVKGAVSAGGSGSGVWNVPVESKATTTYTVIKEDYGTAKEFDTAGGNSAVVLPTALVAGVGATFTMIRKTSNSNTATLIATGSDSVAGAGSVSLTSDGDAITVASDGASTWKQIAFARRSLSAGAITSDLLDSRIVGGLATVGDVKLVPYSTVPTGWLECNGAAISRTTYADLFAKIGTVHGTGDGATTFNLPDYRGRFLRVWAHGATIDPDRASRSAMATGGATGDNVGSVQGYALQEHQHGITGGSIGASTLSFAGGGLNTTPTSAVTVAVGNVTGGTTSTETRPVNAYLMAIILASPSAAAGSATFVNTVYNGSGTPSSGLGINGDFYIDTTGNQIFGPKASGAWPSGVSLVGPAGSTGSTGPAGSTGATGAAGATGASGPVAIDYTWDTSTTAADPGSGKVRASVATFSGSFDLYINETDRLGTNLSAFIQSFDDSTNTTTKGILELIDLTTPANRTFLRVSGTVVDNGSYDTIPVTYLSGATSFSAVNIGMLFIPAGDKGAAGSGAGDLLSTNNLSDVSAKYTAFDNLNVRGADIASASTINLSTATGNLVDVTGTTAITAITLSDGLERTVRFTGILTLTHGASLVLPSGANITTAAGDYAIFRGYAAGVVRCVLYSKASGAAVVGGASNLTAQSFSTSLPPIGNEAVNVGLTASVAASALTIALKGADGNDPSASNPVLVNFRNSTAATGTPTSLAVTAALSVVVSSGSTLGTSNSVPFRVWVVLFNDAGTARLGVINCVTGGSSPTAIYALNEGVLTSSTAEGGAGAADSAATFYTGTAVTTKAYRILGSMEWSSGLGTAGTWSGAPTSIQLYGPGSNKAGDVVQTQYTSTGSLVTGTTAIPLDDTIPQNTEGTQLYTLAITPINASNILRVQSLTAAFVDGGQVPTVALFRDSTVNALAATQAYGGGTGNTDARLAMEVLVQAAAASSTTFKVRGGPHSAGNFNMSGRSGSRIYGGVNLSSLCIQEIMG